MILNAVLMIAASVAMIYYFPSRAMLKTKSPRISPWARSRISITTMCRAPC